MGIKRRHKVSADFSMASMTDVIFLLLIFFMVTSTLVVPNAIKVVLPQSTQQTSAKPLTRITIDENLNYYGGYGAQRDKPLAYEEIVPFLQECYVLDPEMYVAVYGDKSIPYGEIIKIIDIVNQNNFKMIMVTQPK